MRYIPNLLTRRMSHCAGIIKRCYSILVYFVSSMLIVLPNTAYPLVFPPYSYAVTPNQIAVANAIESLGQNNAVFDALLNVPNPESARWAFDSLSGEIYASTLAVYVEESRYIRNAVLTHLQDEDYQNGLTDSKFSSGILFNIWGEYYGTWGELEGNSNAAEVKHDNHGFIAGADTKLFHDSVRLGLVSGFGHTNIGVGSRQSLADSENAYLGIYGSTMMDGFALRAASTYSWHDISGRRVVIFPNFGDKLTSNYNGGTTQAFGEVAYPFIWRIARVEPFIDLAYVDVKLDRFNELGGPAALTGHTSHDNVTYTTLGFTETAPLNIASNWNIAERLLLGWTHAYNNINPQARFASCNGCTPFLITGAPIARDSFLVDAGIDINTSASSGNLLFRIAYIGQVATNVHDNGLMGRVTWRM